MAYVEGSTTPQTNVPKSASFYKQATLDAINSRNFVENYKATRVSYSGCDMIATITVPQLQVLNRSGKANNVNSVFVVGELQTLSYSIHTQDMPVRSFGRKGPKAFTSGPRTIAGSLVFSTFDRHVFRNISEELISIIPLKMAR
jgi:hypothetical protein